MVKRFLDEEKAEKRAKKQENAGYQEETARVEVRPRPLVDVSLAVEGELVPESLLYVSFPLDLAPYDLEPDRTQDGLNDEKAKPQSPVVENELEHLE